MQTEAHPEAPAEPRPSAALDAADGDLRAVEAALGRLDDGSYGRCDVCGGSIPPESLTADPLARTCAQHQVGPVVDAWSPGAEPTGEATR